MPCGVTEHLDAAGICLSCEYWTGARCQVNRRKREAVDTCTQTMKKHYKPNAAYAAEHKKEWE